MIETKNLEELVNEGKIELFKHRRELLISPTDSGRLNMVVSQAHLFNNILYLCDSRKSKKQIEDELAKTNVTNITVLTYDELYHRTIDDFENSYIKSFDLIVCDEIHYIFKIAEQSICLKGVIRFLFSDWSGYRCPDGIKILMMTAEPQYIKEFQQQVPLVNSYHTIELKDN